METKKNNVKGSGLFRNYGWKRNLLAFAAGFLLCVIMLLLSMLSSLNRVLAQFDLSIAVMPIAGFVLGIWGIAGCLAAYMGYLLIMTLGVGSEFFMSPAMYYFSAMIAAAAYCTLPSLLWYVFPLKGETRDTWPRLDTSAHVVKYYLIMLVTVAVYVLLSIVEYASVLDKLDLVSWVVTYIQYLDVVLIVGIPMIILVSRVRYRTITINERMVLSFLTIGVIASALGAYLLYRNALYLDPSLFKDFDYIFSGEAGEWTAQTDAAFDRYFDFWNWYAVIISIMLNILLVVEMILMRSIEKKVTRPILHLSGVLEQYTESEDGGLDPESVTTACGPYRYGYGEVSSLTRTCVDMVRDIDDYMKNLQAVTAEKERIGTELDVASKIQRDMLPSVFPPFPDRSEIDLFASMTPAREVGGDFYDFYFIDHDHLALTIADVSGKGVPASLFMVISKMLLKNHAMTGGSPREILYYANHHLCQNNDSFMFCTVWLGILDLTTGTLTAANAGHEYPAIRRKGGGYELVRNQHDPPLGLRDGLHFREYEIRLQPGDCLFEYTDGVTEATDVREELFGEDRMLQALNADPDNMPQVQIDRVYEAIQAFVKEEEQFDDITMLCVQYKGV